MPTRFYFASSGTPGATAPFSAAWANTDDTTYLPITVDSGGTALGTTSYRDNSNADQDHLIHQFISSAVAAQTFASQTIEFQMQGEEASQANNNMVFSIAARLVSNDGGTVTGTFFDVTRDGTEMASGGTLTNRRFTIATGALTANENDRIVIEVGIGGDPSGGNNHDADIRIGTDGAGGDLPEDDTSTATNLNPWFEFPNVVNFASGIQNATATPTLIAITMTVSTPSIEVHGGDYALDTNCMGMWLMTSSGSETDLSGEGGTLLASTPNLIPTSADTPYTTGVSRDFELDDLEKLYHADGNSTDISGADQTISYMCWFKAESLDAGDFVLISKYEIGTNERSYDLHVEGFALSAGISTDGSGAGRANALGGSTIATATWYHAAVVYNDTDIRAYLNGTLDSNGASNPTAYSAGIFNGNTDFSIGDWSDTSHSNFDGLITEVAVFDRALTAEEIANIYNNGLRNNRLLAGASEDATASPSLVSLSVTTETPTLITSASKIASPALLSISTDIQAPTTIISVDDTVTTTTLSASVTLGTPVTLYNKSAISSPAVSSASYTIGTPTLVISANATVSAVLVSASITIETPTIQIDVDDTVTTTLLSASFNVGAATASTEIGVIASPALIEASYTIGTPVLLVASSRTASPSISSVDIIIGTAIASTGVTESATALPALLSSTIELGSPTLVISTSAISAPAIQSATILIQQPTIITGNSATASPGLISASLQIGTAVATTSISATIATPALLSSTLTVATPDIQKNIHVITTPGVTVMTVGLLAPTVRIATSRTAQASVSVITIEIPVPTASTIEGGGTIAVRILVKSKIETRVLQESRINTRLVKPSRIQTYLLDDSKINTRILEQSRLDTSLLLESNLND